MGNNSAFSVIFSVRAQKEITLAWEWYEERQKGLGDRLLQRSAAEFSTLKRIPIDFLPDINPIKKHRYPFSPISLFTD